MAGPRSLGLRPRPFKGAAPGRGPSASGGSASRNPRPGFLTPEMHLITLWKAGRAAGRLLELGRKQERASTESPGRWADAGPTANSAPWDPQLGGSFCLARMPAPARPQPSGLAGTPQPQSTRTGAERGEAQAWRSWNSSLPRVGSGCAWRAWVRAAGREARLDLGAGAAWLYRPGQLWVLPQPWTLLSAPGAGLPGRRALSL